MDKKIVDYAINDLGFEFSKKPSIDGKDIDWLSKKTRNGNYLWLNEFGWLYLVKIVDGLEEGVLLGDKIETWRELRNIVIRY